MKAIALVLMTLVIVGLGPHSAHVVEPHEDRSAILDNEPEIPGNPSEPPIHEDRPRYA